MKFVKSDRFESDWGLERVTNGVRWPLFSLLPNAKGRGSIKSSGLTKGKKTVRAQVGQCTNYARGILGKFLGNLFVAKAPGVEEGGC